MPDESYVAVGFISPGQVEDQFASSLFMNAVMEPRIRAITNGSSARINRARTNVVQQMLSFPPEFEWFFFADADMVLPSDAVTMLLETAETQHRRIVGGLGYIFKSETAQILPSIIHKNDDEDVPANKWGFIYNEPPPDEPRYIEAFGTGLFCLLVHRSIMEQVQEYFSDLSYPWFDEIDQGGGRVIGPDLQFFERVREATGENPLIDTHVRCGHIKKWTLTHEEARKAYEIRNGL